jgi:predicted glycogen debranching enzyme
MIRYTLLEAHSPTKIRISPFLAFRGYHQLSKANEDIHKDYKKAENGAVFQLYPEYSPLFLQISKENHYHHQPNWYYNIEYIQERERGYEYQEDLWVPGYFEFDIEKGESIIFSAGLEEANPKTRHASFEREITRRVPRNNFENCLINSAGQFIQSRNGETRVIAGYPWFGWWGRDTFVAAPGLTLTQGENQVFLDIVDSMIKDMSGPLFPNVGSGVMANTCSIDAPLWFFWSLQQYILFTNDLETVKKKYLPVLKTIIHGFKQGTQYNIHVLENGLLYGGVEGVALTWMDAVNSDGPVTPRIGCAVEVNALWYNALCFYAELSGDEEIKHLSEITKMSFNENFWNEELGYLADVVNGSEKDWSIRPNMVFATSLPYSPLEESQKDSVLEIVKSKLLTNRGLRSLSPDDPGYKGYYHGNQYTRDIAYHNGTVWAWLLGHFVDGYLQLHGKSGVNFVDKIIKAFDGVMSQYGVGTVAEIYDGDPPHRPKGAISQAWSIGELLRIMNLVKKYK